MSDKIEYRNKKLEEHLKQWELGAGGTQRRKGEEDQGASNSHQLIANLY